MDQAVQAIHLEGANALIAALAVPAIARWQKLTTARQRLVLARMKEEGTVDPAEFWRAAKEAWCPLRYGAFDTWHSISLECLLRVPLRGNPDHFQLAKEGHYRPRNCVDRAPEASRQVAKREPPVDFADPRVRAQVARLAGRMQVKEQA